MNTSYLHIVYTKQGIKWMQFASKFRKKALVRGALIPAYLTCKISEFRKRIIQAQYAFSYPFFYFSHNYRKAF